MMNACVINWVFLHMHMNYVDRMHFKQLKRRKTLQRRETEDRRRQTIDKKNKEGEERKNESTWETVEERRRVDELNKKMT